MARSSARTADPEGVSGTVDKRGSEMPWFSKKKVTEQDVPERNVSVHTPPERKVPSPPTPQQSAPQARSRVALRDPGFAAEDARQLVHRMLEGCGMSILLMAPRPVEHVLNEAVRRAPILVDSSPQRAGVMRLNADENTPWVAVESPLGSAVIVFGTPNSDSSLVMRNIMLPFEKSLAPFSREVVFSGST